VISDAAAIVMKDRRSAGRACGECWAEWAHSRDPVRSNIESLFAKIVSIASHGRGAVSDSRRRGGPRISLRGCGPTAR
jgi:hypothetical protein